MQTTTKKTDETNEETDEETETDTQHTKKQTTENRKTEARRRNRRRGPKEQTNVEVRKHLVRQSGKQRKLNKEHHTSENTETRTHKEEEENK